MCNCVAFGGIRIRHFPTLTKKWTQWPHLKPDYSSSAELPCCIDSGSITWKSELISTWVLGHFTSHTAQLCQGNISRVEILEEPVVRVGVYVRTGLQTEPQDGISLLLLPAAALQSKMCYSPEYRHCGWKSFRPATFLSSSLHSSLPPSLSHSLFLSRGEAGTEPESRSVGLDRITVAKCTAAGTQDVGEKIRDSPRLPGEWKRARWGE